MLFVYHFYLKRKIWIPKFPLLDTHGSLCNLALAAEPDLLLLPTTAQCYWGKCCVSQDLVSASCEGSGLSHVYCQGLWVRGDRVVIWRGEESEWTVITSGTFVCIRQRLPSWTWQPLTCPPGLGALVQGPAGTYNHRLRRAVSGGDDSSAWCLEWEDGEATHTLAVGNFDLFLITKSGTWEFLKGNRNWPKHTKHWFLKTLDTKCQRPEIPERNRKIQGKLWLSQPNAEHSKLPRLGDRAEDPGRSRYLDFTRQSNPERTLEICQESFLWFLLILMILWGNYPRLGKIHWKELERKGLELM